MPTTASSSVSSAGCRVPERDPTTHDLARDGYVFEDAAKKEAGRIDLYRHESFMLKTKQVANVAGKGRALGHGVRGTSASERAMTAARY